MVTEYVDALVIRTIPNSDRKKSQNWSSTNWSYLTQEAAAYIAKLGIKHLLVDLPHWIESLTRFVVSTSCFWSHPEATRFDATITEMIYVPDSIKDGDFFLNLQPASFVNDAMSL